MAQHHTSGTLLLDLERRRPLARLPDREAATVVQWLPAHPGVEVLVRDRAEAYAEAARTGAPAACQVADRFHLLHNVAAVLTQVCTAHAPQLARVNAQRAAVPTPVHDPACLAAALYRSTQRLSLAANEPPWAAPFLEDGFRQDGRLPRGQEARRRGPGQETFEGGELAIHAAGLQPPLVHQEALIVPEIGRGDVCRGQLVTIRVPEPAGEGRQVTAVVLDREGTVLRSGEVVGEVLSDGAILYGEFFTGSIRDVGRIIRRVRDEHNV